MDIKELVKKYGYSGISSILRQLARESYQAKKIDHDAFLSVEEMAKDLEDTLSQYTGYAMVMK